MLRSLPDSPDNVFVHIFKGMLLLIKEQIGSLMQSLLHMLRSLSPPSKTSVNSLKIQELFFVTQALESYRRKEDILREFLSALPGSMHRELSLHHHNSTEDKGKLHVKK